MNDYIHSSVFDVDDLLHDREVSCGDKRVQIYSLSDLHADHKPCFEWLKRNCTQECGDPETFRVFVCAGDISHDISKIRDTLLLLKSSFDEVCYVPGNHDLWMRGSERYRSNPMTKAPDSVAKLREVLECALDCGVTTGPLTISPDKGDPVCVFPLQSWYHSGWDTEPEISHPLYVRAEELRRRSGATFDASWMDFRQCSWPGVASVNPSTKVEDLSLASQFGALNRRFLPPHKMRSQGTIISFSHFVPRQELMPEKKYLLEPLLAKVIGSDPLEKQIRQLQPDLHIFGHTHIPIELTLDGIRYLQWPLGNPREATAQCRLVHNTGLLLVYDSALIKNGCSENGNGIPSPTVCSEAHWSRHYTRNKRDLNNMEELSPWLTTRLQQFISSLE